MALFTVTNNEGEIEESLLTAFNVSPIPGNGCVWTDNSPYTVTLYHNGVGAYPTIGDSVFEDPQGTTLYDDFNDTQADNGTYFRVSGGVLIPITCR